MEQKMENYKIVRFYPVDCDDCVVEIWSQNNLIAILSENNEVELFRDNVDDSIFESDDYASALEKARIKLGLTQDNFDN